MSERQLNFIIALLCLNFAWDAIKVMMTMYYDREDRMELNYRLDRLEEFLVRKTVVQCSCDCCDCCEEDEEDTQEEAEEDTQEEAEEEETQEEAEEDTQEADEEETQEADEEETHEEDVDETQEEAFVGNDGAVYAYKINLNAEDDTRTVTKVEAVNDGVQTDA